MGQNKKHLTYEQRAEIEDGVRAGKTAGRIAAGLGVSTSTITREVKTNRKMGELKPARNAKLSLRCAHYKECEKRRLACPECLDMYMLCKNCKRRTCINTCPDYKRAECPKTQTWPYVCLKSCEKRQSCRYPKYSYCARDADLAYHTRLTTSREGIDASEEKLAEINAIVTPLVRQGQSFSSIVSTHKKELGISERTLYNYVEKDVLDVINLELPRKVSMRPRKKTADESQDRINREGRTYEDFTKLTLEDQLNAVQCDSVCGTAKNKLDIFSLYIPTRKFQIYLLKRHANPASVVRALDAIELACGSLEAFMAVFSVLLVDRGVEFDDWAGMESSALEPGKKRCSVYYCDAMKSNQKSQAERNHEQLRRILPKGRTDMDKLSPRDVATCCSHVNSYVLSKWDGRCAFEIAAGLLPQSLLDTFGFVHLEPDAVTLKPELMPHAIKQKK